MKFYHFIPAIAIVSACASSGANYRPILDGAPSAQFNADLADCQALAQNQRQFDQETTGAAAIGAAAGGLLGALDEDGTALGGAVVGALAGGAAGAVDASERREAIVIECLKNRGHAVVG